MHLHSSNSHELLNGSLWTSEAGCSHSLHILCHHFCLKFGREKTHHAGVYANRSHDNQLWVSPALITAAWLKKDRCYHSSEPTLKYNRKLNHLFAATMQQTFKSQASPHYPVRAFVCCEFTVLMCSLSARHYSWPVLAVLLQMSMQPALCHCDSLCSC